MLASTARNTKEILGIVGISLGFISAVGERQGDVVLRRIIARSLNGSLQTSKDCLERSEDGFERQEPLL